MKRLPIVAIAGVICTAAVIAEEEGVSSLSTNSLDKVVTAWEESAGRWLSPHVHFNGAVGHSSGNPETLGIGHHDPNREGGSIQGIELGGSLRIHPYIEGFATYNLSYGASKQWEDELEEAFLKLISPDDYGEIRGGRMLTRFGQHNAQHLHAWNSVDMPLVIGRFLGDDGLIIDGGDITGYIPVGDTLKFGAVLGYGERPDFGCSHGGDEDGHNHADHAGVANDDIYTGRLFAKYTPTDFFDYTLGFSAITGEYGAESFDNAVIGADFSIGWRENGFEAGGKRINWTTEVLYRDFDAEVEMHAEHHDEHDDHDDHGDHEDEGYRDDFGETGLYTSLLYSHNAHIDGHLRLGWVEGVSNLEQDERTRISPALTWWIAGNRTLYTRVQYNYDNFTGGPDEHSIWLQFGVSLGKEEVR